MNPTPNEPQQCCHSGPPKRAPIHGLGGAGNVEALHRWDGRMNCKGRSGVQGGRPHGGAVPGQLDTGGSFFFGARGVEDVRQSRRHCLRERPGRRCGRGAGPPKIADCGATAVKSVQCQGKEAKEGILAVIIFHNRMVALFTNSIIY
jgi:hypothetical protein